MSWNLKIALFMALFPVTAIAAPYTLNNLPNPSTMAAGVTPGQTTDNIQPDNQSSMLHLFRTGEGWSTGHQEKLWASQGNGCDWHLGTGCSFNNARECELVKNSKGDILVNTCKFELMVNATYFVVNPNTGQASCDSAMQTGQSSEENDCEKTIQQVIINWGDGSTSTAQYDYAPSQNEYDPSNVPMYIGYHTYTSMPDGHAGTYTITVTENMDGTWRNHTTYTHDSQITWDLNYGYYGNGSCTYGWSGTNQMTVSTSAGNSGYFESIDFNPTSGFSGATNITGATQVCSTGSGNSGVGGSGWNLYPLDYPAGSPQQVAYGNDITLDNSAATWSGGPITVGNAWGWFEFYVANPHTVDITYNGGLVGSITATRETIAHTVPVLDGGQNYTQTLQVYVYHNTPPAIQTGAENASPTLATSAEEGN